MQIANIEKIKKRLENNRIPQLKGTVPHRYDKEVIEKICKLSNVQSAAIDYLYKLICEQQKEIEILKHGLHNNDEEDTNA